MTRMKRRLTLFLCIGPALVDICDPGFLLWYSCIHYPVELSSEQLPTDVMVIDKEPTPSSGDVGPGKSDKQDTTPPLPTASKIEETAQKKHVQDEENMDDLPEPMNRPQAPNQLQINNNPSSGIPQTSPNRGQSSPMSFSTPMKSEEFLHRGGGRSVSANPPGPYPMPRAVNSREYSPNWYGTPYGTGVYGRGSFGPGYTSPPGPYWTQAPQFETHESIYEDHEEMTHEDVREEEYRSMNLVRKLYENIGSQMSGQDVDPVIPGSRFNPPSKYPNNGKGMKIVCCVGTMCVLCGYYVCCVWVL